jgi:hypothetical protein
MGAFGVNPRGRSDVTMDRITRFVSAGFCKDLPLERGEGNIGAARK